MITSIDFYSFTFIPICDRDLILRSHRRVEYLISVSNLSKLLLKLKLKLKLKLCTIGLSTYKITRKVIWVGRFCIHVFLFFYFFISRLKFQGENWCSFRFYQCDSDFSSLSDAFEPCMVINFRSYALLCQFDSEWLWGPNFNYEMVSEKLNWFFFFFLAGFGLSDSAEL